MPIVFKNSVCKIEKQSSDEFRLTLDGEKNKKYLQFIKKNLVIKQEKKNFFVFKSKNV